MKKGKPYVFVFLSYILASATIIFFIYYAFGVVERASMMDRVNIRLDEITEEIELKQNELDAFITQLAQDNESRAKALAIMILQSPSLLKDNETLEETRVALGVDDINISDENGIIVAGTSAYTGDIFGSGHYIEDFMPAIKDKSFAKTVTEDVYGTKRFYTGVARLDKAGIVQITSTPVTLKRIIQYSDIATVLGDNQSFEKGITAVIDTKTYKYLSHTNEKLISTGVQISRSRFEADEGSFASALNGKKATVIYRRYGEDKILLIQLPDSEIYSLRNTVAVTLGIVQAILLFVVLLAVRHSVVLKDQTF